LCFKIWNYTGILLQMGKTSHSKYLLHFIFTHFFWIWEELRKSKQQKCQILIINVQ